MFLKATRFSFLAVKFNYASLFFHLTFRRIILDMKVNLQILFRIFANILLYSSHVEYFIQNYVYWILIPSENTISTIKYLANTHKASQISINHDLYLCFWIISLSSTNGDPLSKYFLETSYRFISPKMIIIGYLLTVCCKIMLSIFHWS